MTISYNDYRYIMGLKKKPTFIQKLLKYELLVTDGYAEIKVSMPIWLYLLVFIPVHIIVALSCVWDGGLKSFEFVSIDITTWTFQSDSLAYEKAKEVYKN